LVNAGRRASRRLSSVNVLADLGIDRAKININGGG
jgi:hypothetical protein